MPAGHLHLDGFESYAIKKRRDIQLGGAWVGDDIGLDCIMELPPSSRRQANARRAFALDGFESYASKKEETPKWVSLLFWWTI